MVTNVEVLDGSRRAARIHWVKVSERVPDDRRPVLAWGPIDWLFGHWKRTPKFLGITRFNVGKDGARGHFDCEHGGVYSSVVCEVTHWAEIVGPE